MRKVSPQWLSDDRRKNRGYRFIGTAAHADTLLTCLKAAVVGRMTAVSTLEARAADWRIFSLSAPLLYK